MHKFISKANDQGGTLERFRAPLKWRLAQKMQDDFKPRQSVLIIDYIGEWREKALRFLVRAV